MLLMPLHHKRYPGVHPVLGDAVAFHGPAEVLDPDGLDVLHRLGDFPHGVGGCVIEALFGLGDHFHDLHDGAHEASCISSTSILRLPTSRSRRSNSATRRSTRSSRRSMALKRDSTV